MRPEALNAGRVSAWFRENGERKVAVFHSRGIGRHDAPLLCVTSWIGRADSR